MPGLYFEEMEVGATYKHAVTRTVTEADNVLFTCMTMNPAPIHLDAEYAKTTIHGRPLVNSIFILALIGGMSVYDLTFGTTLGNLGFDKIEFPKPVFHGDTIRCETTITDKRESKSRTDSGIVWFELRGINQRNEVVCVAKRVGLVMVKPQQ